MRFFLFLLISLAGCTWFEKVQSNPITTKIESIIPIDINGDGQVAEVHPEQHGDEDKNQNQYQESLPLSVAKASLDAGLERLIEGSVENASNPLVKKAIKYAGNKATEVVDAKFKEFVEQQQAKQTAHLPEAAVLPSRRKRSIPTVDGEKTSESNEKEESKSSEEPKEVESSEDSDKPKSDVNSDEADKTGKSTNVKTKSQPGRIEKFFVGLTNILRSGKTTNPNESSQDAKSIGEDDEKSKSEALVKDSPGKQDLQEDAKDEKDAEPTGSSEPDSKEASQSTVGVAKSRSKRDTSPMRKRDKLKSWGKSIKGWLSRKERVKSGEPAPNSEQNEKSVDQINTNIVHADSTSGHDDAKETVKEHGLESMSSHEKSDHNEKPQETPHGEHSEDKNVVQGYSGNEKDEVKPPANHHHELGKSDEDDEKTKEVMSHVDQDGKDTLADHSHEVDNEKTKEVHHEDGEDEKKSKEDQSHDDDGGKTKEEVNLTEKDLKVTVAEESNHADDEAKEEVHHEDGEDEKKSRKDQSHEEEDEKTKDEVNLTEKDRKDTVAEQSNHADDETKEEVHHEDGEDEKKSKENQSHEDDGGKTKEEVNLIEKDLKDTVAKESNRADDEAKEEVHHEDGEDEKKSRKVQSHEEEDEKKKKVDHHDKDDEKHQDQQ